MIEIVKVIFLSFIEGLTEFIPVSSTGHMIIVEHFITLSKNRNFVSSFEVIIQLGAILSVLIYFRKEIFPINISLWSKVVVAVVPAAVLGLLFDDFIEAKLFNITVVSIALIFYGIILIFIEKLVSKGYITKIEDVTYKKAFLIGAFQCLAMIPGTSRSASTIIGAMFLGLNKIVATKFSFFLAMPTMLGASLLKLFKLRGLTSSEYFLILIGFVFSFIFAYMFIAMFITYIKKHDFKVFGYYRIILAILVLGIFR